MHKVSYCHLQSADSDVAAAMALMDIEGVDAETVARKSMKIAGDMCVYTNHNLTVEILETPVIEGTATPAPNTTP
jgi:hypothetical protein